MLVWRIIGQTAIISCNYIGKPNSCVNLSAMYMVSLEVL